MDMTLFNGSTNEQGMQVVGLSDDILAQLQGAMDNLAGGGVSIHRLSLRGSRFRKVLNGEQLEVLKIDELPVVVVDAAPVSRIYYEGTYDADTKAKPTCWSDDGVAPNASVKKPLSSKCATCPMNIKGSGQGQSRACRFNQRLAVVLEDDMSTLYQLTLPAASIFGEVVNGKMPMQAYARLLKANKAPIAAVVTGLSFDEDAEVPKLFFRPMRPLNTAELTQVLKMRDSEECKLAMSMDRSDLDAGDAPAKVDVADPVAAMLQTASKTAETAVDSPDKSTVKEEVDAIEEPKRASKSAAKAPEPKTDDLASIIDEWDD